MRIAAVICSAFLSSCGGGGLHTAADSPRTEVAVDTTTPDRALKSYWAVRDAMRQSAQHIYKESFSKYQASERQLPSVAASLITRDLQHRESRSLDSYERDIQEVKVETESRAQVIAVIKNITPVPVDAEMTKYATDHRQNGDRYRYVLEKEKDGWRVAELWEWDTFPTSGWKKVAPASGKPDVPWMTYEAR